MVEPTAPGDDRKRKRGRAALALPAIVLFALACQLLNLPGTPGPAAMPTVPVALPTDRPSSTARPLEILPTTTVPASAGQDQARALLPAFAADADLSPDLTRYWIETAVDFAPGSQKANLSGQARIRYVVPPGETIDEVPLMLWPNDAQYEAAMTAGPALVNGVDVAGQSDLDGIVLRLPLPQPASGGQALDISLPFAIEAGGPIGGFDPKRFGITEGVLAAPTFYPLVPRRVDGDWQVEAAPPGGDTTNSDTAYYQVDLTYPAELALAASGVQLDERANSDGTTTARYASGPMRDFAFVLGPLDQIEETVDGVVVRAWTLPEHAESANEMLQLAAEQLGILNELVGPYPYPELDVVDVPGAFGGIEYPGIVFIGTVGTDRLVDPTVHEVAHQWFYALIGDDQLHEPWLDEATATYAEVLYFEAIGEPGMATGMLSWLREQVRSHPEPTLPIGRGVDGYGDPDSYYIFVYYKGALFLDALRGEIGDEAFRRFLKEYFVEERYGFTEGAEFQQAAEEACSCQLDDLFNLWVWEGGEIPGI